MNIIKPINPCYDKKTGTDCSLRTPTCHAKCEEFKIYEQKQEVYREQMKQIRDVKYPTVVLEHRINKSLKYK